MYSASGRLRAAPRRVRKHDVVRRAVRGGEQDEEKPKSSSRADQLRRHETGDGSRGDAGEGVAEDAADGHGRVRERRRGREPVRRSDVGAHSGAARTPRLVAAREKISRMRPAVATTSPSRCPAVARSLVEMEVPTSNMAFATHAAADRAYGLGGDVGAELRQGQAGSAAPAKEPVGEGNDGIEMGATDGPEHQDQYRQTQAPWRCCSAAAAGPHHWARAAAPRFRTRRRWHHEQAGAEQFGDGTAPQRRLVEKSCQQLDAQILTQSKLNQ